MYDLSEPDVSSGTAVTFDQCVYNGSGVKTVPLPPDYRACDLQKKIGMAPALVNACRAQADASWSVLKYYGRINQRAAGGASAAENFTQGSGVLTSIACTVDNPTHSGDATSAIGCSNVQFRTMQLDLVNREDVKADSWTPPQVAIRDSNLGPLFGRAPCRP